MKRALLVAIVCLAVFAYAQKGGGGSTPPPAGNAGMSGGNSPGAYDPHPNPSGMDAPPPIEQTPQDAFMRDPKLVAKLQKLLPDGPSIRDVCDGFKRLGECVCVIHASQNLGIPLADLKTKVTGKNAEKLENAIRELKPDVDAKAEKKKAYKQAEREIPVSN